MSAPVMVHSQRGGSPRRGEAITLEVEGNGVVVRRGGRVAESNRLRLESKRRQTGSPCRLTNPIRRCDTVSLLIHGET
ncbi:MAG: hypothetical protein ACRERV_12490 [Methylococcales bacterium]